MRKRALDPPANADRLLDGVIPAEEGAGPLYQRDYWAVIEDCRYRPSELIRRIAEQFEQFPPEELCRFARRCGEGRPLQVGDELDIHIRMAGDTAVRVVHGDACSFTLATLEGHPEAGRITFGAYRNDDGDVVFHIRSHARAGDRKKYLGFLAMGEAMQTNTWTDFISAAALIAGKGVQGEIHSATREIEDEPPEAMALPTFLAQAD